MSFVDSVSNWQYHARSLMTMVGTPLKSPATLRVSDTVPNIIHYLTYLSHSQALRILAIGEKEGDSHMMLIISEVEAIESRQERAGVVAQLEIAGEFIALSAQPRA